ncbi:MAG: hypothetical protein KBF21_14465 [Thermoanaerobaculia bacterium]|jgi:hypothetical protein|nr:hypothetical protein [Thermoanaerobaculia bacterium]MBP9825425.1 hypothetical protein [Thermoanaerobaculia bacterium]
MNASQLNTQSAAERRAAEAALRALIARFAPAQVRLVGALRRSLLERLPTAHELVYEYRDWIVISYSPSERGYEGVLAIRADAAGVKLYFNSGKGLPDPEKLLRGSGTQARWVSVESASTLARPAIVRLVDEALARSGVPFPSTGRGPIVIRSASKKKG